MECIEDGSPLAVRVSIEDVSECDGTEKVTEDPGAADSDSVVSALKGEGVIGEFAALFSLEVNTGLRLDEVLDPPVGFRAAGKASIDAELLARLCVGEVLDAGWVCLERSDVRSEDMVWSREDKSACTTYGTSKLGLTHRFGSLSPPRHSFLATRKNTSSSSNLVHHQKITQSI